MLQSNHSPFLFFIQANVQDDNIYFKTKLLLYADAVLSGQMLCTYIGFSFSGTKKVQDSCTESWTTYLSVIHGKYILV